MKSKLLLLFMVTCMGAGSALAQLQTFDLALYKNPFYKRSQLDFTLNLNGSTYWNENKTLGNSLKNSSSGIGGQFYGTFFQTLNSETVQRTRQISFTESPSFAKYENDDLNTSYTGHNNQNYLDFSVNTADRFYKSNLTFFELDINADASHNASYSSYNLYNTITDTLFNSNTFNNKHFNTNGSIGLRYGKGRIESVEDARLAVYILDDLQKHNRLAHAPTSEEILEFAKVITKIKNKRFFDARLRKIEEITVIDSFLTASNLSSAKDAAYFTTVNDNWDNAAGPARSAGFRYSVGISPNFLWNKTIYTGQPNDESHIMGVSGDLRFDYSKPINLYWQLDGGLDLKYSFLKAVNADTTSTKGNVNQFGSILSGKLGYYPNSRSYYSASLGLQYIKAYSKLLNPPFNTSAKGDFQSFFPTFTLNGYYYISQQLRFQFSYTINYFNSKSHDSYDMILNNYPDYKNFSQNFSVTLTYSFF